MSLRPERPTNQYTMNGRGVNARMFTPQAQVRTQWDEIRLGPRHKSKEDPYVRHMIRFKWLKQNCVGAFNFDYYVDRSIYYFEHESDAILFTFSCEVDEDAQN